jgi:cell division protein FtsQ
VLGIALFAFAVHRGGAAVAHARALQVDRIAVRGNSQLSTADVAGLLSGLQGENIILTDLDNWRTRLLDSPWVKDAALRRILPSTVEVTIQERQPVGLGRIRGQLFLFDEDGVVIDQFGPAYAAFDLPVVDGLAGGGREPQTDIQRAQLTAQLLAALRAVPELIERVSQIDVRDPGNAGVLLKGDTAVLYLGADRFLPRLQSYLQLAEALRARVPEIDSVDLRFDDQVIVRPLGRTKAIAVQRQSERRAGRAGGNGSR